MSFIIDLEDFLDIINDTIETNHTPYIVDPKTLSCEAQPLGFSAAVTMCIVHFSIFLLAIPGNLLVGCVICSRRQNLAPSDVYLFHLTVADGLLALTLPFWAIQAMTQRWLFGDFMCKFLSLILEANFYTSILFLACISIDRYLAIVHTTETRKSRQQMCSRLLCGAVWVLGWALALPALFNDAFQPHPDSNKIICSERYDIGSATSWRITTRGIRHIFGFFLPLIVMVTCYSITIARLLRTRGFQKHRAMKVILVVVAAFLLCWAPYHFTMIVDSILRADLVPFSCAMRISVDVALIVTHGLALFHSCINPILYAFVGEKFRNNLKLLLQKKLRKERMSGSKFSRSTSQTSEGSGSAL
ncbi:C-X-C chemokine receptor type 1 [Thalassophryne amazonica]|uniref:C-X-C chemokine receptor type 1 n=1 Tax=Thalassophryne amazonica TaxID=390379 RepID=UPI0014708A04|nr:C-X-C chemokine receptor type 1 [Thalassophryne amazonica]